MTTDDDEENWRVYCEDCRRDAKNSFPISDLEKPADKLTDKLTDKEQAAADQLARVIKDLPAYNRGMTIWKVCNEWGVDHHKIARHLGERKRRPVAKGKGKGTPWIHR